jgi:hypothetical protein
VLVGGVGVAAAAASWDAGTVATPRGYFDFCQDKQRTIANITAADLAGENNGGNDYAITATIYPNTAPGTPDQNSYSESGFLSFVNSKSGITVEAPTAPERRVLLAQYVEYRDGAAQQPTQIRCKMRTAVSLNTPGFQSNLDGGPASTVPWGFGAGTASGPEGTCAAVNQESVTNAWSRLSEQEKDDAPFRPEPRDGDPVNLTVEPDVNTPSGPDWTLPWDGLQVADGELLVRGKGLIVSTTDPGVTSDKFRGSHYCTFVAPEYLLDVFLGNATPPAPPVAPGPWSP